MECPELTILAHGSAALTFEELQQQRRAVRLPGRTLPPGFLKNSEEQTVAAFVALAQAIGQFNLSDHDFSRWGVIGVPRFFGRAGGACTMSRFEVGGPASTSVHVIPEQCLHSLSGTVSLALGAHGPNFGAGGGFHAIVDGCLSAISMIDWQTAPGTWLIFTEWSPEPVVNRDGTLASDSTCHALALGLVPANSGDESLHLRLRQPTEKCCGMVRQRRLNATGQKCTEEDNSVRFLSQRIVQSAQAGTDVCWTYSTDWGMNLELFTREIGA